MNNKLVMKEKFFFKALIANLFNYKLTELQSLYLIAFLFKFDKMF